MYSAQELFELLNDQDECPWIEAKRGSESSRSILETVCAYCNEPSLGGGYILIGAVQDEKSPVPLYTIESVKNPDKFQSDFSSQCASIFNIPVRPQIFIEKVNQQILIKIFIAELTANQKPLYFQNEGLPKGAYRRVGSTDQRCTQDDLPIFYQDTNSFDQTIVKDTTLDDIDENAIKRYRNLREKVNPVAEELSYDDAELLQALGCVNRANKQELNIAGLLLFGSSKTQRSTYPMLRVDYIRVPGNTWVANPDDRFTTIDMRGPLILLLYRLIDAINADLPKGFLLNDNDVQASSVGLPLKALREAIVNALMHRSYREHRPTQVIRYDNRIEIINPGFSLKAEDRLGEPGSETRNPFIAAIFHDTNLAETKGSGIRAMRKLMENAHLVPPTFDSSRENNQFTSRLLLHHFLDEKDIIWLNNFNEFELSDAQKQALIFIREVNAIDNQTYRQMANCDIVKASIELRALRDNNLITAKGKGKATYYVAGSRLSTAVIEISTQAKAVSTQVNEISTQPNEVESIWDGISEELKNDIANIKGREHNPEKVKTIIKELCAIEERSAVELGTILNKGADYLRRKFLNQMISEKQLKYKFPDMINHPEQAYITVKN